MTHELYQVELKSSIRSTMLYYTVLYCEKIRGMTDYPPDQNSFAVSPSTCKYVCVICNIAFRAYLYR